jgi:predicted nucleotidyltransferase
MQPRGDNKLYVYFVGYMFDCTNMRFHSPLTGILGSPIRVALLRVFTRFPTRGMSGRELAGVIGASPSQTNAALSSLMAEGLVHPEVVGRSHIWRFSTEHVLADPLTKIFETEAELPDLLMQALRRALERLPAEKAALFGSVARGDEGPDSDIDLFVQVRDDVTKGQVVDALSSASAGFALRFGNVLSSFVLTRSQVARRANPSLARNIEREGVSLQA